MIKRRVLITGASGFIGHHLVAYLLKYTDWDIVTLDRLDVSASLNRLTEVISDENKHRVKFVFHDLKAEINSLVSKRIGPVDYIYHLGAASHVTRSIEDPLSFVMDNVVGTTNLLNWARSLYNLIIFFNFSTDEVFGTAPEGVFFHEGSVHNPSNPYSAAKSGADQIARAFQTTYGIPVITTHTVNVFGERQFTEKFVSKAIKCAMDGTVLDIHCIKDKDGTVIEIGKRFWIDALDVSSALFFLTHAGVIGEEYNITGIEEINNVEIADMVSEIIGKPIREQFVSYQEARPGYDKRYALDGAKLSTLGWDALPVKEGLERVVKWTINQPDWR